MTLFFSLLKFFFQQLWQETYLAEEVVTTGMVENELPAFKCKNILQSDHTIYIKSMNRTYDLPIFVCVVPLAFFNVHVLSRGHFATFDAWFKDTVKNQMKLPKFVHVIVSAIESDTKKTYVSKTTASARVGGGLAKDQPWWQVCAGAL